MSWGGALTGFLGSPGSGLGDADAEDVLDIVAEIDGLEVVQAVGEEAGAE